MSGIATTLLHELAEAFERTLCDEGRQVSASNIRRLREALEAETVEADKRECPAFIVDGSGIVGPAPASWAHGPLAGYTVEGLAEFAQQRCGALRSIGWGDDAQLLAEIARRLKIAAVRVAALEMIR